MKETQKFAIIMAGGSSPILWPDSNENFPKQFNHYIGDGTLLQDTFNRVAKIFSIEDIYVVTIENYFELTKQQLPNIPEENIILEPFPRNTLPCATLAITSLSKKFSNEAIAVVFPSDHYIPNVRSFLEAIETAIEFADSRGAIVAIGVPPSKPETNYGYIQTINDSQDLEDFYIKGVRYIKTFVEKPDRETAKRFLETKEFLWNTGIYVWKVSTFWETLRTCSSETYNYFQTLKRLKSKSAFKDGKIEIYQQIQAQSLDFGLIEPSQNIFVVSASFTWSDIGSWDELFNQVPKDSYNNFIQGNVYPIDVKNSLIISKTKPIGVIDIEDIIVIESEKAILICKRGKSERAVELVNLLKRKNVVSLL